MQARRVRLIDCTAAVLWMAMVWLFVRGGVGDLRVEHVWALAVSAAAAAMTVLAGVTSSEERTVSKILQAMEDGAIDRLLERRREQI